MRHVLLHYHIFKNAGSTIDAILKNNFGDQCGSIEGRNPWDTVDSGAILRYTMNNPNIRAISSHQARLPVPNCSNIFFHPLMFLRHPIDRVGSVYSFERNQPINSKSLGANIAREKEFAGYVKWRLSDGNGAVIKNFQTVYLSGREHDMRMANATESDLKEAMETVSQLPFFGLVEHFRDSMEKMRKYLSKTFGSIDVTYSILNKSTERKTLLQERLDDIELMLGPDLYQELLEKNKLDMRLYDHALNLFFSTRNE